MTRQHFSLRRLQAPAIVQAFDAGYRDAEPDRRAELTDIGLEIANNRVTACEGASLARESQAWKLREMPVGIEAKLFMPPPPCLADARCAIEDQRPDAQPLQPPGQGEPGDPSADDDHRVE